MGAREDEEDEDDDEDDEGDPREEDGWSWRLGQPMSSVMSSAAGASHAVGRKQQRAERQTRLLSSAFTRQVKIRHSRGKSGQQQQRRDCVSADITTTTSHQAKVEPVWPSLVKDATEVRKGKES